MVPRQTIPSLMINEKTLLTLDAPMHTLLLATLLKTFQTVSTLGIQIQPKRT